MEYGNNNDQDPQNIQNFLPDEASPINLRLFTEPTNPRPGFYAATPQNHLSILRKTQRKKSLGDPRSNSKGVFEQNELQCPGSHSKFERRVNLAHEMSEIADNEYPPIMSSAPPPGLFDTKGAEGFAHSNLTGSSSSTDSEESRNDLINDIIYINNLKHVKQNRTKMGSCRR